jgi:type I restriction enzyme S subunit
MSWKKVTLGDILTESKIISESPNADRRIKVKLKVLGVEKRGLENEVEGATKQYIRKAGQFIYGKQNFHKGAFGIVPPELDGFESSSDLPAFDVDESCLPEFIFYYFKQGNFYLELSKIASGVATQRINTAQLFELELLLPDINTQKHLISNIQKLEKNGAELSTELTHQLTLVKKLRQQLLQDAVQGKLVEQDVTDEPASELLKKIKAEKKKLIAEKKLKKEKELPPIKPEEIPFEIPENWVWCRLGEIVTHVFDGPFGSHLKSIDYTNSGVQVIRLQNLGVMKFKDEKETFVSQEKYESLIQHTVYEGDIIIGSFLADGVNCVILPELKYTAIAKADCFTIRIKHKMLLNNFIMYLLSSKPMFIVLSKLLRGMTRLRINTTQLKNLPIPLPPLSEQHRIIQKLEELMQYCDELEASIKQSEIQNEKLLQQVLKEALRKESVEA